MNAVRFHCRGGRGNKAGKLPGCCRRSPPNNGSGDSPRPPFLSVFVNEVCELVFVRLIHHLCGGHSLARILTHIQRAIRRKTESPVRFVELQAAGAEVGEQAVERCRRNVLPDGTEGFADQRDLRSLGAQLSGDFVQSGFEPGPSLLDHDRSRSGDLLGRACGQSRKHALRVRACSRLWWRRDAHGETQSHLVKEPAHGVTDFVMRSP